MGCPRRIISMQALLGTRMGIIAEQSARSDKALRGRVSTKTRLLRTMRSFPPTLATRISSRATAGAAPPTLHTHMLRLASAGAAPPTLHTHMLRRARHLCAFLHHAFGVPL